MHTSSPVPPTIAKQTPSHKAPKRTSRTLKPLKVLSVNLNSIVAHSTDLCNMVDSTDPDIIVGVIDASVHIGEILPKQYLENVVRADRKRGGGRVITAAKDDFICSEVTELQTQCEIAWMKMEIAGCKPL